MDKLTNHKSQTEKQPPARHLRLLVICYALLALLFLAALSYWAPWVNHSTAALKLSGQDLGEFIKFIPAYRTGQIHVPRQLFYLPPLACMIGIVMIAINRHLPYPRWLRVLMLGLALLLLPGLLPPVWGTPKDLFTAEFRLQGIALVLGLVFILAHGLFRNVSLPTLSSTLAALALLGLIPAQWAFWTFKPSIWAIYHTPTIHLGWGMWLNGMAWIGLLVAAVFMFRQSEHN